jgi:ubiquinone/menaquinone biosynthesis C-methylase UbiE
MSTTEASPPEKYNNRGNPAYTALLARRTAEQTAPFVLRHLVPGMRVLDAGCGPGSITIGLAEAVMPDGEAVGVDMDAESLAMARTLANERGVANVRFEEASIYALPFADASFDAACAVAVLFHLADPVAALRELHRALKPGGVIAIGRDPDCAPSLYPTTPLLERWRELVARAALVAGTDHEFGRRHRAVLLDAGFRDPEAHAAVNASGTLDSTRQTAETLVIRFRGPNNAGGMAVREGWATEAEVEAICDEIRAWGERPDTFSSQIFCSAVAWKPG